MKIVGKKELAAEENSRNKSAEDDEKNTNISPNVPKRRVHDRRGGGFVEGAGIIVRGWGQRNGGVVWSGRVRKVLEGSERLQRRSAGHRRHSV